MKGEESGGAATPGPGTTVTAPEGERTRLGEALLTAAGLDTVDLGSYLQELDAADQGLAAEVRRRIDASAVLPSSFMALPAAHRLEHGEPDADLGATCFAPTGSEAGDGAWDVEPVSSRYALGDCLGQGGMARVFRARDGKLSRTVALKFLTRREPHVVGRFLREARAQAQVTHEHVLEVYDTGDLDGQPYIAMRHVAGQTLGEIRDSISLEQQVRLAIQAARGLHAAHSRGLIHRDVKPSNILVEETEEEGLKAFVADFGIATEPDAVDTSDGLLAGTPAYIAPELLGGPGAAAIDRRVDVYALGVTLYELFSGRRPFEGDDAIELLKQAAREDAVPLRQRAPSVPVDLEAVVMRCLARDPDGRYPSARAVADDLQRFLDGEVVDAYAAGLAYRWTRFALRHRLLVATAGIALLTLLVASVAVAFFAVRADRERQRAEAERIRADQRRDQAEDLIGFMVSDLRGKLASVERLEVLDGVHAAALDYFAAVPAEELTDDELAERSRLLYQIGEVRMQKGDPVAAVTPFRESLALANHLVDRNPGDGQRLFDLGQSQFWLGYAHWRQSDAEGALPHFEAYLDIARRLHAKDPNNQDWRLELGYALGNLGEILQAQGDFEGALALFENGLEIDRQLYALDPQNQEWRFSRARNHDAVARSLRHLGRLGEAAEHHRVDIELKRELVAAEPVSLRWREFLATSLEQYGALLHDRGDLAEAGVALEEARGLFEALVTVDPENSQREYKLAWARLRLGRLARDLGEPRAAETHLRAAGRILSAEEHQGFSDRLWRWAEAVARVEMADLTSVRDPAGARAGLEAAGDVFRSLAEEQPGDLRAARWLANSELLLARLAELRGDRSVAEAAYLKTLEVLAPLAQTPRSEPNADGRVLAARAEALLGLGRGEEARPVVEALRRQGFYAPRLERTLSADP